MADSKYSEEIKFYKPKLRFIIPISNFHYPKKLFSEFKKTKYSFKIDQNFAKVIELCKEIKRKDQDTWINEIILDTYIELHKIGKCHSVECYVANGEKLTIKQEDIKLNGSSIECRINAEHPESFIPSPGKITQYHQPGGLGIRVDSAVYDGYSIPSHYDSMIGKLITYGATRSEALKKMNRALEEYVIMGINTNIQLHQKIIQTDEFKRGSYNINFMSNLIE